MRLPPADKPSVSPANARPVVMLRSPREAAARAIVYRRRRNERPRDRGLRIAGLVGTLLVHLLVLFGAILGPAYDYEEPVSKAEPLQVRLIDKPEPPPPPPVRGTPPKRVGPTHRGSREASANSQAEHAPALPPTPTPAKPDMPVITVTAPVAAIRMAPVAAPPAPLTLPHPQPTPDLAPVPLAGTPPQVNLDMPPIPRPVPPRFQPTPVRKPQVEGNRPLPPPPSLAMPEVPAQASPPVAAPSLALDHVEPPKYQPSIVPLARPQPPAAPPTAEVEPIPLPAQAAPTIHLAPQLSTPTPSVPREQLRVQAPTVQLGQPQPAEQAPAASHAPAAPSAAPAIELPASAAPAVTLSPIRLQAPAAAGPPQSSPVQAALPIAMPAAEAQAGQPGKAAAQDNIPSSAPDASPQGNDAGTPGAREAAADTASTTGAAAPRPAAGSGQGQGKQGKAQPGAAEGAAQGKLGSYIQLKPHGDTDVMHHRAPDIGYQPTRFEDDWAPENESSLDTALRHAIEKTTVKKTFHLPRGVRVECKFSPLHLIALLGCGNPDPPAKAAKAEEYRRQYLAPSKPLDPTAAASVAKARPALAPAAPIQLDNAAQCAAARVSGGPLPPGCPNEGAASPRPIQSPASAASSWVPASDQFH